MVLLKELIFTLLFLLNSLSARKIIFLSATKFSFSQAGKIFQAREVYSRVHTNLMQDVEGPSDEPSNHSVVIQLFTFHLTINFNPLKFQLCLNSTLLTTELYSMTVIRPRYTSNSTQPCSKAFNSFNWYLHMCFTWFSCSIKKH